MNDKLVKRLGNLRRHIRHVQDACELMAERLTERDDFETARTLLRNVQTHDLSKYFGIEWEQLNENDWPRVHGTAEDEVAFREALALHVSMNDHHPECWEFEPEHEGRGIHRMKRVHVMEMVADWHSRASEQGTDLRDFVENRATARFNFTREDPVHALIEEALGLLLEPRFT